MLNTKNYKLKSCLDTDSGFGHDSIKEDKDVHKETS